MLFEAFFWDAAVPRPGFERFRASEPEFAELSHDFGARAGDCGVVAELAGDRAVAAACHRCWTDDEHSYGYVAPDVPELAIGVDPRNVAAKLYRSLGFAEVGRVGTSLTLVLDLRER